MAGIDGRQLTTPEYFTAPDGARLSYRRLGEGRPLLMLHGFLSSGTNAWIGSGHARRLADRGHHVVLPDLRAHGRSAAPADPSAYPADVLVDDAIALLSHLGIDDLDAVGYSLGARTVLRMLVHGTPIRRAVLGGQGLAAMQENAGRTAERLLYGAGWFRQLWSTKTPDAQGALRAVLASSVATPSAQIRAISTPVLVVTGDADDPAGGAALAAALPNGRYARIAGDHVRAAGDSELAELIETFLDEGVY